MFDVFFYAFIAVLKCCPKVQFNKLESASEKFRNALLLLAALKKYALKPTEKTTIENEPVLLSIGDKNTPSTIDRLEASLLLWNDYLKNGSLPVTEKIRRKNGRGRVNWTKTIRESTTLATSRQENDQTSRTSIFCPVQVTERVECNPFHPITILHQYTCYQIAKALGQVSVEALPFQWTPREILQKYAGKLSTDRQQKVISWLKKFYLSHSKDSLSKDKVQIYVAKSFEHIWEEMCRVTLNASNRNFYSQYHMPDGTIKDKQYKIDVWFESSNQTYVLDAKYKEDTNSLFAGSDFYKQIVYAAFILNDKTFKDRFQNERGGIYNGFLVPANLSSKQKKLDVYGIHSFNVGDKLFSNCGHLVYINVDVLSLIQMYVYKKENNLFRAEVIRAFQTSEFRLLSREEVLSNKKFKNLRSIDHSFKKLDRVTFVKSQFDDVTFPECSSITDSTFTECVFSQIDSSQQSVLTNVTFNNCTFETGKLKGHFQRVTFKSCHFKEVTFEQSVIPNVTFKKCTYLNSSMLPKKMLAKASDISLIDNLTSNAGD